VVGRGGGGGAVVLCGGHRQCGGPRGCSAVVVDTTKAYGHQSPRWAFDGHRLLITCNVGVYGL